MELAHSKSAETNTPARSGKESWQIYFKDVSIIKQITKDDIEILLKKGILHNTNHGYVDRYGNLASYYRTCHKIYIGDKYADLAKKLNK